MSKNWKKFAFRGGKNPDTGAVNQKDKIFSFLTLTNEISLIYRELYKKCKCHQKPILLFLTIPRKSNNKINFC